MNWKSTAVILGGILTVLAIACAIYIIANHNGSRNEIEELSIDKSTEESSTIVGVIPGLIIDVPCGKGTRYDATTNSCRGVIRQVPKK